MDLFVCSKCGANLIEYGIREVTEGGITETPISFNKAEHGNEVEFGEVDNHKFTDQWVVCPNCGAELHDRNAIEIIEAFQQDLPHIRRECAECGKSFAEVECGECEFRAGQCTGIREDKDLCQECCAEEFRGIILTNPIANLLAESS
jgi:transcription initiation factor IIE alpha subunit